jgi:hypothetical protein
MMTPTEQSHAKPSPAEENAYLAAQLAVDALVDFPGPGTRVPEVIADIETSWVEFGQEWWRILCSGSWFLVRPYMRANLEFHRDPSLSLATCTTEMKGILGRLRAMSHAERADATAGMLAARDAALREAAAVDGTRKTKSPGAEPPVWSKDARKLAVAVHALQTAIDELREGVPSMPWWTPTGPSDRFYALGEAWAVYFRTGLARQLGGDEGEALARTIVDPPLSANQALAGLEEVCRGLAGMTPRHRAIAFAAIDLAWREGTPIGASPHN